MKLKTIHSIGRKIADLKTERERLIGREKQLCVFSTREAEKISDLRPDYDFVSYQKEVDRVEGEIRNLTSQAIRLLSTEKVKEYHDMTILEMLLLLKDLKEKEQRLYAMSTHMEVERHVGGNFFVYDHLNYDIAEVEEDLRKTREELDKVRTYTDFFIYELSYDFTE